MPHLVTITRDVARRLSAAARKQREWTERRNEAIVQAHADGASLREIAEQVGLAHSAVAKIVKRSS